MLKITKEDGEELSVGGIPTSCEKVKELGLFKGNGLYPIFFKERGPIDVYCHKDFNEDFYQFVLGGDMEKDEKTFTLTPNLVFSDEENSTPNGSKSLKLTEKQYYVTSNHFTYVDPSKSYRLSGKIKVYRNGGLGSGDLLFVPYDEKFRRIEPFTVRGIEGSETEITRKTNSGDKTIYFRCDDNLYNSLLGKLGRTSRIAYDIKEDYSDLPNRKLSGRIGTRVRNRNEEKEQIRGILKRISETECSLLSKTTFLPSEVGRKIRFHLDSTRGNFAKPKGNFINGEWMEYDLVVNGQAKYLTGLAQNGVFWPGTKFIKVQFGGNLWARREGNVHKVGDETSVTYFDDIKLEVSQ